MSPETAPAGLDDPAPVAPASPAREAGIELHPRYQREVDPQGVAEVAQHGARLGAPPAESCDAGEADCPDGMPTFWFDDAEGLDRFGELVEHLQVGRSWRWYLPSRAWPLEVLTSLADWLLPGIVPRYEPQGGAYGVAIPTDDLPRVTAALREIPTPSPYGPLPTREEG